MNQNTSVTFGGASNFALSFGDNVGPGPSANVKLGNTAGISATQTANAQFGGSVSSPIRVVTGNYTLANDDYTVLCNNTADVGAGHHHAAGGGGIEQGTRLHHQARQSERQRN